MARALILCFTFAVVLLAVHAGNEKCDTPRDCPDAGTTCINQRCICWTDMGPSAADAWSCDDDNKCEKNFPGHACRPSLDCVATAGRMGYCQPR